VLARPPTTRAGYTPRGGGKSVAKLEVCVGVWQFTTALRKFL
jgi:hypothetical protein